MFLGVSAVVAAAAAAAILITVVGSMDYSRSDLLNIGRLVLTATTTERLPLPVYRTIQSLGISNIKPTCRGKRGGKTNRCNSDKQYSDTVSQVNTANLIKICKHKPSRLCAALINARSLCNKAIEINDYITDNTVDLMCVTETWLKSEMTETLSEVIPPGYDMIHKPRLTGRGGGVGIIYRETLAIKQLTSSVYQSFEHMLVRATTASVNYHIVLLYRPPPLKEK